MVQVKDYDHAYLASRAVFDPIFLGDKTALIRADATGSMAVSHIVQLREHHDGSDETTGRMCEVEITHIDSLSDGMVLLSITLVG